MASSRVECESVRWHKSSYSNGSGGNCVEVGIDAPGGLVPVRDTKRASTGPVLAFPATQWGRFIATLHNGRGNACSSRRRMSSR
ncbi:DUF397 domain-containing protein [Streptomyces sp. NPDC006992]|uniref:DUF397 domain-containing protein n=1 Tax=Streptomyces sp. NPDC006992 TaxID=3155601 RepID=UPI0033EDCFCF